MRFRLLKWNMYGNDTYGDCVFAACAHCWMALVRLMRQRWSLTNAQVVAAYKAYMAKYDNGKDAGSTPGIVLQDWHTNGMWGTILPAWAEIDHTDKDEVRQGLNSFGCLMVCVNLPKPAYTYQNGANYVQFRIPTWRLTGTPDDEVIVGAHEIAAIGYDKQYIYCVSWGMLVRVTQAWWNKYVIETEALIVPAIAKGGAFDGLDLAALQTDLAALRP